MPHAAGSEARGSHVIKVTAGNFYTEQIYIYARNETLPNHNSHFLKLYARPAIVLQSRLLRGSQQSPSWNSAGDVRQSSGLSVRKYFSAQKCCSLLALPEAQSRDGKHAAMRRLWDWKYSSLDGSQQPADLQHRG